MLLKHRALILICSILLLGFFLRAHNLSTWPRLGATFDEYAWTWLGLSLINNQMPSAWSPHSLYEDRSLIKFQDAYFIIVKPYLEHPPFFGLVAGSFAKLNGVDDLFDIHISKIRPLALILGMISIVALFLLTKLLYGEKIAILATLLYATVPTIVIGSRIVQNENFFIPCFLFALYFIILFINTKKNIYRNISALICGILVLSKVPWFAAPIAITAILFYKNKYLDAGKFLAIVLTIFGIFILYGLYFDSDLFINLWKFQMQRYALSFNSVFALFTEPFLVDRYKIDGWIYFGWFAFILLLIKDLKKNYIIILSLFAYLGIFIFAIPNEAGHGWYRFPFYPFLIISIAIFIKDYFNKNILLTFLFILLVGLSLLEMTFKIQFGFSFLIFRLFLVACALILLPLFFKNKTLLKYSKIYNLLMLMFIFSLNFWAVMEYNEQ